MLLGLHVYPRIFNKLVGLLDLCHCASLRDDLFCALHAVVTADHASGFKKLAGKHVLLSAFSTAGSAVEDVLVRSRAVEIVNHLIAESPLNCALLLKHHSLTDIVELMACAPDFLLQSVIFEIFYRLTLDLAPADLEKLLDDADGVELADLMRQGDSGNFVNVTRKFLNKFNAALGPHQRIYSFLSNKNSTWVDFGVSEMQVWNAEQNDSFQYKELSAVNFKKASNKLELTYESKTLLSFVFHPRDHELLEHVVIPRIQAIKRNAGAGVKVSVASICIPNQTDSFNAVPEPAKEKDSSSSSSPSFAAPKMQAAPMSSIQYLEPRSSLPATQTPLTQTLLHFGNVVEQQIAEEKQRLRDENQVALQRMKDDMHKEQQHRLRRLSKRTYEEMEDLKEDVFALVEETKKHCMALANEFEKQACSMHSKYEILVNNILDGHHERLLDTEP